MKSYVIFSGAAIAIMNCLILLPPVSRYGAYLLAGSIAVALWMIVKFALAKPVPTTARTPVEERIAAAPIVDPMVRGAAEREVITLLAVLQEKGRLIDFLMDDVAAYSDAQVGAAARAVHQGCRSALDEHFDIAPVASESEGSQVIVEADAVDTYRFTGKVAGSPPFSGKLVHKGWKAISVKLPRSVDSSATSETSLPPLAPAQVEIC